MAPALPLRSGVDVYNELGGRMLLRYVNDPLEAGKARETYVSPTAYSIDEVAGFLALPNPKSLREHVLFLDPRKINQIKGPTWCVQGQGIEYLLPDGYDKSAIIGVPWAVEVR